MPTVPQILQMRQARQRRTGRRLRRLGLLAGLLLSSLAAVIAIAAAFGYASLTQNLPSIEALPALLEPPDGLLYQPTRLYDRSGQHVLLTLENPAAAGWQYLPLAARAQADQAFLPRSLVAATLASTNPTFWEDNGYTLKGLADGSHPTLAQQLVSELLLADEAPSLRRALRERLLAAQTTSRFGRERVLEWYLNSAYYGRLAYGADAAARVYFGKSATQLTVAESALLVAVAQAPALNPLDAPQAALERQKDVLRQMQAQGLISPQAAEEARQAELVFAQAAPLDTGLAPAFTNLVMEQLTTRISRTRLERGGLRVITSLDYQLQQQAVCSALVQIARLGNQGAPQVQNCPAAARLPALPAAENTGSASLAAQVVILNPSSGEILALVGDTAPGLDPARLPGHPVGTLFTPFVYLTGFTRGLSPASLVWDIPPQAPPAVQGESSASLAGSAGPVSSPDNPEAQTPDFTQFRGPMRLRMALANDARIPAWRVLEQVGPENVWRTARQVGLTSLEPYIQLDTPAASLASSPAPWEDQALTLLEVTQAYGVFANQGILTGLTLEKPATGSAGAGRIQPLAVRWIEDTASRHWWEPGTPHQRPVLTTQLAYLMTNVLSDEPARWPTLGRPNALEINRPAAAKTGQTISGQDAWTIGYTPQLVVGVWIGETGSPSANDSERPGDDELPVSAGLSRPTQAAAGLWNAVIQYASQDLPAAGWTPPPGVSNIVVCDPSGLLPTADCPAQVNEVFLAGNEPTQRDTLYRAVQINRENGRLATVFTPAELVYESIFMIVPPEALAWAQASGLPAPPAAYDIISNVEPKSPQVHITSPAMFAVLRGEVTIEGQAGGPDFASYRIQVGSGLNPQEWLQVGQDSSRAVSGGPLAVWDTRGLNGLYAVQLLVFRQDQKIEKHTLQVTVDNQAPEVTVLYPQTDPQAPALTAGKITFQVEATDNLAVAQAEFFLDGKSLDTVPGPVFALPWNVPVGDHTLRVVVTDRAGNTAETSVEFSAKE